MTVPVALPTAQTFARAAAAIEQGQLIGFPTETVYGLGADAGNDRAVARLYAAKGRPRFNPLIVHLPDAGHAARFGRFDRLAMALAEAFWPGALTLVVPRRADCGLSDLVSAGHPTVALRVPDHGVALALLEACGRPLAAPSANPSGRLSPTRADAVAEAFAPGTVALVIDGGATRLGLESTIIGLLDGGPPLLLRPGGIPRAALEAVAGPLTDPGARDRDGMALAPGRLASHYAPRALLRLNATTVAPDEALLAFGPTAPAGGRMTLNLSASGDTTEAAANLFAMLRILDRSGAGRIAVMPIPARGLGEAIIDRLSRAAAPREG